MDFKTKVTLDLGDLTNGMENHDVLTKNINLRWNAELEIRQYGVKSVIITVPRQTFIVDLNLWGDEQDEEKPLLIDVNDVIVEQPTNLSQLVPQSLEFYNGKWKLVF